MMSLDVVLRHYAVIHYSLFAEKVHSIGLLQQNISHVFFVFKDLVYRAVMPTAAATDSQNAVTLQASADLFTACTFKIFTENPLNNFRLLWVDDKIALRILVISKKQPCIHHDLALLKAVLKPQLHILT